MVTDNPAYVSAEHVAAHMHALVSGKAKGLQSTHDRSKLTQLSPLQLMITFLLTRGRLSNVKFIHTQSLPPTMSP